MNDEKIIELYFQRCENAIKETDAKYGKYCYAIAYNILFDSQDAEESVNDTYLNAWNCIPPHKPSVFSTFLGKITRRISIDKWRRRNAEKRGGGQMTIVLDELSECISDTRSVEDDLDRKLLEEIINRFVTSLPKTEQQVFILRYWHFDSVNEICKKTGFSESKIKSVLYRTREKLRKTLMKEGFENAAG